MGDAEEDRTVEIGGVGVLIVRNVGEVEMRWALIRSRADVCLGSPESDFLLNPIVFLIDREISKSAIYRYLRPQI